MAFRGIFPLPGPLPPEGSFGKGFLRMHALIIEDDAVIAMMIEDELRDLGYSTFATASTEHEAIEAVARRCPDLVTADGPLFSGTGPSAVRRIRSTLKVPVVFITGDPEHARHQFPGTPVLEKPFTVSELIAAVELAHC
jgi:CheY-like chemotaxis protein